MIPDVVNALTLAQVAADAAAAAPAAGAAMSKLHVGIAAAGGSLAIGFIGFGVTQALSRNPGVAKDLLIQAILFASLAEALALFAIFLV